MTSPFKPTDGQFRSQAEAVRYLKKQGYTFSEERGLWVNAEGGTASITKLSGQNNWHAGPYNDK